MAGTPRVYGFGSCPAPTEGCCSHGTPPCGWLSKWKVLSRRDYSRSAGSVMTQACVQPFPALRSERTGWRIWQWNKASDSCSARHGAVLVRLEKAATACGVWPYNDSRQEAEAGSQQSYTALWRHDCGNGKQPVGCQQSVFRSRIPMAVQSLDARHHTVDRKKHQQGRQARQTGTAHGILLKCQTISYSDHSSFQV